VVLAVLVAYSLASPVPDSGRVVNGTNAKPGEIPYIVSLRYFGSHSCGASILDETHVLTASHCVDGRSASSLSIQYGVTQISSSGNVIQVSKVAMHEAYAPWNAYANDIAVLTLDSAIVYGDSAQPVALPEQDEAPPAGDISILAGWGYPYTGGSVMKDLQRVDLLVYSDEDCKAAHGTVSATYHVCSGVPEGGKGQCSGDSGGPLVANGKQIGAVSWSVKPCTIKGYPGVYARVSSYIDWIKEKSQ